MHSYHATSILDLAVLIYIQRCASMEVYEHVWQARVGQGGGGSGGGVRACFVRLSKSAPV